MTGVIGHADDDVSMKCLVVHRGKLPKATKIWVRLLDRKVEGATVELLKELGSKNVVLDEWQCHRLFRLASGNTLVLCVPLVTGRLVPGVLGASVPPGTPKGEYEVVLIVLDKSGKILGAFSLMIAIR